MSIEEKPQTVIILLLLPFLIVTIVSYVTPWNEAQVEGPEVFVKMLPMLQLVVFVLAGGLYKFQIDWKFCTFISLGLGLSSVGDVFRLYDGDIMLLIGMALYGVAHIFYTIAFGFKPFLPLISVVVALPAIGLLMVIVPKVGAPLEYCIPIYTMILVAMEWRIFAKLSQYPLNAAIVCTAVGAVSLAISDSVLAYNKFHSMIKYAEIIVPLTYYIGQLGIAISVFHLPYEIRPRDPTYHISLEELYSMCCA